MGGHRGSDSKIILGSGKRSAKIKRDLRGKMKRATATGVATAAVEVVAMSNPGVAAAYAAYKLAKFAYPIVKEGVKEYIKTGDKDKAVEKMEKKAAVQIVEKVKEKAVEHIVNATWETTKSATGMKTDETTDKAVTSAVSTTVNELIENDKK